MAEEFISFLKISYGIYVNLPTSLLPSKITVVARVRNMNYSLNDHQLFLYFISNQRLTPLFMFILLFKYNVLPTFKQATDFGLMEDPYGGQKGCQRYWWTNFLYIHNFYPKSFWGMVSNYY